MSKSTKAPRSTYERALDMLEARARATDELRRLLVRKGEPADAVDDAIVRLSAMGLLDDANFARQFTRSKALGAALSRRRIRQELARRGVSREIAAAAIEEVFADERMNETTAIERVARKKLRTLGALDVVTQRRRLYGFLARRGYDGDDIGRVLGVLLGRGDAADADPADLAEPADLAD